MTSPVQLLHRYRDVVEEKLNIKQKIEKLQRELVALGQKENFLKDTLLNQSSKSPSQRLQILPGSSLGQSSDKVSTTKVTTVLPLPNLPGPSGLTPKNYPAPSGIVQQKQTQKPIKEDSDAAMAAIELDFSSTEEDPLPVIEKKKREPVPAQSNSDSEPAPKKTQQKKKKEGCSSGYI
ncbi:Hypothetical predicted protein [Mytilus galloprovincialis]|uniref:Uncharacterized protein n=1 Tax=Mytilus galloprovincialis TaxID=29158 RepID=A0A8B6BVU4_MYTGA|nr:Hypothetical predicted protein [Mytilus galloprovincialis]